MELPPDYEKYFEGKIVVITGVARSGTSIMGKVVGSLRNCFYSFEPVSFTLISQLIENKVLPFDKGKNLIEGILFEDVFLQAIHGRNVNFNERDDSYIGNYIDVEEIKGNWEDLRRRRNVLNYLNKNKTKFIVKNPNLQPCMKTLKEIFSNIKFIHMVRNGNEVISSSMKREFYTEEHLNNRNVDCWSIKNDKNDILIPWYVKNRENFSNWNYQTRCAHIWRVLNSYYLDFKRNNEDIVENVKLEELMKNPEKILNEIEKFVGKERTDITEKHLESINNYDQTVYRDSLKYIDDRELKKFKEMEKRLGY